MAVKTKLQVRRDTAANWTSTNPTLASGEIGFETDTLKFKIGNGSTAWNSLAYQNASTSAQNYAQTLGTKTLVTSGATVPYTIVSVTITTSGSPVLIMASGDAENLTASTWCRLQLFRGTTAIGNDIQAEGTGASENSPYALQVVDAQAAGTYTYHLKVTNIAGGNFNFGENTGPVITAIELNSLAGSANLASNLASGAAGSLPYQSAANTTTYLARTATNNSTLAFNSATNAPFWVQPTLSNTYYASTTAAQLINIISNTTGTAGNLVFSTSPVLSTPNIGAATGTSLNVTGSISSNTTGQGSLTLGDAAITKQSGSSFQFGSGGTFTQVVSAPTYTSTVAIGTAPFTVTSTTKVTNLNADTVDGYDTSTANSANTIVVRSSGGDINANVVNGVRFISNVATGTAPFTVTSTTQVANLNVATSGTTSNVLGGAAGRVLYQSGVNTTAFLTAPATNNSLLTYNTATGAPEWDSPPLTMSVLMGYTSTATAAGATSLTNTSSYYQQFTGTTTQTVILPNTATLLTGWTFHIVNNSTGNVTANTFANAATLMVIPANTTAMVTCINTASNTATGWEIGLTDFGTYTGTGSVVMGTLPTITPADAVATTSATQAGYIGMPQNSKSGAYTLAAGDAGKHIYYTTTGQTVTIPNNTTVAFQIGTAITFITAPSVSLSIAITTDTLRLANTTTTGTRTLAANGVATAIKVTSTAWIISGNGLT